MFKTPLDKHNKPDIILRATGYGLRATGYGLRATGYGLVLSLAFPNVNPTTDSTNFFDTNDFFSELPLWSSLILHVLLMERCIALWVNIL